MLALVSRSSAEPAAQASSGSEYPTQHASLSIILHLRAFCGQCIELNRESHRIPHLDLYRPIPRQARLRLRLSRTHVQKSRALATGLKSNTHAHTVPQPQTKRLERGSHKYSYYPPLYRDPTRQLRLIHYHRGVLSTITCVLVVGVAQAAQRRAPPHPAGILNPAAGQILD